MLDQPLFDAPNHKAAVDTHRAKPLTHIIASDAGMTDEYRLLLRKIEIALGEIGKAERGSSGRRAHFEFERFTNVAEYNVRMFSAVILLHEFFDLRGGHAMRVSQLVLPGRLADQVIERFPIRTQRRRSNQSLFQPILQRCLVGCVLMDVHPHRGGQTEEHADCNRHDNATAVACAETIGDHSCTNQSGTTAEHGKYEGDNLGDAGERAYEKFRRRNCKCWWHSQEQHREASQQ